MKFTSTLVTLFATLAVAHPTSQLLKGRQDPSELPTCAQPCFTDNLPVSGCADTTDYACLCASSAYNQAVLACVSGACDAADQLATLTWATATCDAVGVPIEV